MKNCVTFILSFLLVSAKMLAGTVVSPVANIRFSHISINDGLSQNTVFSITQDKKGNMWFATYDGINKYDGYDFTIYRHDPADTTSIASNTLRTVVTDSNGRLWIGTRKGLSYYNEEKDLFENYFLGDGRVASVTGIVELPGERLLVSADSRLYVFDMASSRFSSAELPEEIRGLAVSALGRSGDLIYIGTSNQGLYVWAAKRGQIEHVSLGNRPAQVQAILQQSPTRLWVGTEGDGLYRLNPQTGERRHYLHSQETNSISSNYIRALALDSNGQLWVGTFNDLNIYHEGGDTFAAYTNNSLDSESLSQRSVRCIFKDSQGGMWLGTYFGGLNYYHPLKNRFRNIRHLPFKNSLSDNVVSCIVEDKNSDLWIGTNDGGVNHYDTSTGIFTYYTFNKDDRDVNMESNNVKTIYVDERENLVYVGTHAGGLKVLHRNGGRIEHYFKGDIPDALQNIYVILPCDEHTLWIGTLDGLFLFDTVRKTFMAVDRDVDNAVITAQSVHVLFRDSLDRLWVGGEDELRLYQVTPGGLRKLSLPLPELSSVGAVQCIHETADRRIWIATRLGLYCLDEKKNLLAHYTTADGLPNNVVYGIEEGAYGFIWVSTNHGLSCFNPNTGKFRNFTASDGLQSNQFNTYSHCRTANGQLYFGGINGITTFRPELLIDNPYTPRPVITGLLLYNRPVRPNDETGILGKHISETESITLNPSQRAFTLKFVVSNYISGQHNTFAYKLEGYDKEWYYLTDKRSVSYSNLSHGRYRFLVKAANSDGKWNAETAALDIVVLPVWYNTWWARLLFFVVAMLLAGFVFRYFWIRKVMKARIEMEHKEKIHQEEINQMKMRFFIDISHELRTPLTLIVAPVQEMIARTNDKWMREQLKYVERNANRLLHLVNQLMDYRRAELGVFKLKVANEDVYQLVKENFSYYEKLAHHKGLDYTLISDLEGRRMYVDAKYLELILNNLLSNAFKYTEKGSIKVRLTEKGRDLLLEVSDTGAGIASDKHKRIFERFYQLESTHIGSGIGLSLVQRLVELHHGRIELASEEGKGSTFSIYLPQDLDMYAEVERQTQVDGEDEYAVHSTNSQEMYFVDTEKAENESVPSENKKRGTLLVVEDNEEIRHYLNDGLSPLFAVIQAGNGQEALDILKNTEVDIVITDVMMPVMNGIKLCKQIKQNICISHIPVIMLSAKTDIDDQMEAFQIGADDYISKPFALSVLITKIQNMMRTRLRMLERYSKSTEIEPEKVTFNAMDEELLRKAISVVEKNIDNSEFSAEDFARAMNMSRSNLHLKLKAITGESAIEFIRKIRFNEACRLLKDGRYNIAEISTKVGFNTPSYFATSFKKYVGCLPTEYVKQHK